MDLFRLPLDEFKKELNKFLEKQTPEQIVADLIRCGLELSDKDKAKWIDPIYINTEEELDRLVAALEKAAKKKQKEIKVDYEEITDSNKIKEMFNYDKE